LVLTRQLRRASLQLRYPPLPPRCVALLERRHLGLVLGLVQGVQLARHALDRLLRRGGVVGAVALLLGRGPSTAVVALVLLVLVAAPACRPHGRELCLRLVGDGLGRVAAAFGVVDAGLEVGAAAGGLRELIAGGAQETL